MTPRIAEKENPEQNDSPVTPNKMKPLLIAATALAAVATGGALEAVTVLNAGFEYPVLGDEGIQTPGPNRALGTDDVANPTTWIPGGTDGGIWNPNPDAGFTGGNAFAGQNTGW